MAGAPDAAAMARRLAESDAQIAALKDQVQRLSRQASPRERSMSPRPFSGMPAGIPPASPRAGSPRAGSPRGTRPRSASPRGGRPGAISPGSPNKLSAFGSTVHNRKKPLSPATFFTASMRGGPLTDPMPQRGLTERERLYPEKACRGPSLLTRERFGAPKSEWVKYRDFDPANLGGNMMEDDNPFNDPFKYHPFKGMAFAPSDYIGPDDARETDDLSTLKPGNALRLSFVYGYTSRKGCRSNLFYNADGHLVYHAAALGIVYDKANHEQYFFHGHDDDICALDLSPKDRLTVVTGQMGKEPKIMVWSSRPEKGTHRLPRLCIITGDHKRAIIGLSFNRTGEFIASMGLDNNRMMGIYKWKAGASVEKMRIGMDKGHSDEVYQLHYNPVTDHVVCGGKKFLRFFGLKEGALSDPEADARAAAKAGGSHTPLLAENESKIWAKKGTFGAEKGAQDICSLAFDHEGVTYAGSGEGIIYRFSEQATDLAVQAHPLPDHESLKQWKEHTGAQRLEPCYKGLCRVTAMWFDTERKVLISSGDDGWLHQWDTTSWGADGGSIRPQHSFDLNAWVVKELKGQIVKMDDKELDKDNPMRGRPAACYSIHGDGKGNIVVGTVCNEIYEIEAADFDGTGDASPMCIMQGHYDELWGLAIHPKKRIFCTGAEDETLRVWDMDKFTLLDIAKLMGPVRCASYSPNAEWVAVGLGGKNAKHKLSGKWVVLDADTLDLRFEPPHTRFERVADIKFSPNSEWIAVGNADNGVDIYSVPGYGNSNTNFKRVAKFEGHSSFIAHLDWSEDSKKLQTNCGAHELLYWKLYDENGRWKPRQEKSSSSMKDEIWETQTCIFGWHIRGIWCEGADGTDINACARNNTMGRQIIATSDDFGTVKLFRYPSIVPYADNKPYGGHSSHVTNVGFDESDKWLVSTAGEDRAVFQWELITE